MHNRQIRARRYVKSQGTLQLPTGHYGTEDQSKILQHRKDLKSHLIFCVYSEKVFLDSHRPCTVNLGTGHPVVFKVLY